MKTKYELCEITSGNVKVTYSTKGNAFSIGLLDHGVIDELEIDLIDDLIDVLTQLKEEVETQIPK